MKVMLTSLPNTKLPAAAVYNIIYVSLSISLLPAERCARYSLCHRHHSDHINTNKYTHLIIMYTNRARAHEQTISRRILCSLNLPMSLQFLQVALKRNLIQISIIDG